MIKVSRLADYGVVILAFLSGQNLMTAAGVSEETGFPEPTVAKVLKLLAKSGLLLSVRGASGGYKLVKPAAEVTVAEVVMAVDGPVSLTACVEGSRASCDYASCCPVKGRWDGVNDAIRAALEGITLADMAEDTTSLAIESRQA